MKKKSFLIHLKKEDAFTMIELLMALLVVSIIGGIIAGSYVSGNQIKTKQDGIVEIQQNIRVALHLLSRELKMAGYEPATNWNSALFKTTNQITSLNQASVSFSYVPDPLDPIASNPIDMNGDGILDNGQTIALTYNLNAGILNRNVSVGGGINTAMPIVSNISSITFSFFNDDGTGNRAWATNPAVSPAYTVAIGITVVAESTRVDPKHPVAADLFTDPYTGTIYTEPTDQRIRRMASTVVNLRNM